jgi:xanthine dehydrogenase YagS FAD-binding subunit
MRPFEYTVPTTARQAVALLAAAGHEERGSLPVAGGSDLVALLKDEVVTPGRLVDLTGLADLRGISPREDGGLVLGALTPLADLAAAPELAAAHPALARALGRVASPQIRSVGTLGGNLCQRPRCWYFRLGYGLLALHDGESMVRRGDDRYHAILGNDGPALFVSPSTVAPLLIALGAEVSAAGPRGERTFPLAELYRVPRADGESELTLARGEIVTRVALPPPAGRRAASYEVRQRKSLDWSLATASVVLGLGGGRVREARVVLGQVAPVPWRAEAAERALAGQAVDAATAAAAADAAVAGARPIRTNAYKIRLARTAVKRAILEAAGRGA